MARRGRLWIILILAVGVLAACSSGGPSDDGATAGTVPTIPPTTNPYAVPEVVDVAYVNRVLAGLDQAMGEITRLVVAARAITPEALDRLKAIYVDEPSNPESLVQLKINGFEIGKMEGFAGYQIPPGNNVTTVTDLITAGPSCVFAKVNQDYSAITNQPPPRIRRQWVGLVPLDPAKDPSGYNPTRWVYVVNGVLSDMSQPENPCVAGS